MFATHLKDLETKDYTRILNDTEIMNIAQNDFGVKFRISTVQHIKDPKTKIPPFQL